MEFHVTTAVQEAVNNRFTDHLIGTNGPVLWQPRSPDLTTFDLFLLGLHLELSLWVYAEIICDLDHLRERTDVAISTVTPQMFQNTSLEVYYRGARRLP